MMKMGALLSLALFATLTLADYWHDRAGLLEKDRAMAVGSSLVLNSKEQAANEILMSHKLREYDDGFVNPENFPPAQHFFKSKAQVEESEVFKIIRKLPKGSSLHCHVTAMVSNEFLFNLTYNDHLYGCIKKGIFLLQFFNETSVSNKCNWQPLTKLRATVPNFDTFLKSQLTLIVDHPEKSYTNINSVWKNFDNVFQTVGGLLYYQPIFKEYFYQVLKELYEDNVMYLEFRGALSHAYDLEGNVYNGVQLVGLYFEAVQQFQKDYPDFQGVRFIYAPSRRVNNATVEEYVKLYHEIVEAYPDFVAGFDLVGQEDLGYPLVDFVPQLLKLKEKDTKFFFHAGETNWNGESTDLNLFDAVLLNTSRIGHGYAILKHPALYDIVKERRIALEISPISNQVLKLVNDYRNHPGSVLIANNFPVVVTSDDPSFWDAKGLSYDWYFAFMGLASREDDLRFLKQLAINSIEYSAMGEAEKEKALVKWNNDWDAFIDEILSDTSSEES